MMKKKLVAIVKSSDGHIRKGRGFSRAEISHVGLTIQQARRLGIPIDKRRKTAYVENINKLLEFLKKGKKNSAS